MAVTIHVNGKSNSLAHKGSGGIAKCTLPDVCKTPSPGGPVPTPYPVIISQSSDLKKGSKKVKFDGGNSAAIKGSELSRCSGDEAGTAGGVKSSTNMKEATWILYSFDVKIEGKNACRLSDKMMMNHGNTACLAGVCQQPVVGDPADEKQCKAAKGNSDSADAMLPASAKSKSYVVAGGRFIPEGGSPLNVRGASAIAGSAVVPGRKYHRFSRGIPPNGISNVSCGSPHVYQKSLRPKSGHAEAKIIEDIFARRAGGFRPGMGPNPVGGKLYLNVKNKRVCCSCQKLIACAQKAGLKVILCGEEGEDECPS